MRAPAGSPWAWHPHPVAWALLALLVVGYVLALRRLAPTSPLGERPAPGRVVRAFVLGVLSLTVVSTWPLADLARRWSMLAHVTQHLVLLLVAPPLLLLGLPDWLAAKLTSPAVVDGVLSRLTRPLVATIVFNAVVIGTMAPVVVDAEARSPLLHGAVNLSLLVAGILMWTPVLHALPGRHQLSPAGKVGYLFVQSIVPNFPALILVFADHVLYHAFAKAPGALGLSPLLDQRLAGAVAKLGGIGILWVTAGVILMRAQRAEERGGDTEPLTWRDVERELDRVERRRRKSGVE
jgi:putative membrane protein